MLPFILLIKNLSEIIYYAQAVKSFNLKPKKNDRLNEAKVYHRVAPKSNLMRIRQEYNSQALIAFPLP